MHKKTVLLLFGLLVGASAISQTIEAELQTIFNDNALMGLSVIVTTNSEVEEYHFGLRDFDRNLPITQNTHYRIASISKAFSALGLLKLVSNGEVALDDDISNRLGYTLRNPNFPNIPITYRMLLSHKSGLQDGTGYSNFLNATYSQTPIPNINELLLPGGSFYTSNMWRTEAPDTFFAYSNINFGLVGTLIEAISGERFDIFMKNEILIPLTITGSYNIQDLQDINDVAVLYRNNGGWQPQFDDYQGVTPTPPDLSNYIPGTNGAYFSPQGGLRSTPADVNKFLTFLNGNPSEFSLSISESVLTEMKSIQWDYNGINGDNYFGLFNRWGLGLQHANVTTGDMICNLGNYGTFLGHAGEAYGLISDAFYSENEDVQVVLMTNGAFNGYSFGTNSSFYQVEEDIFSAVCERFQITLNTIENNSTEISISPNPFVELITVKTSSPILVIEIYDIKGRLVFKTETNPTEVINLSHLEASFYFAVITTTEGTFRKKLIKK